MARHSLGLDSRIVLSALVVGASLSGGCSEYDIAAKEEPAPDVVPDIRIDPPALEYGTLSTGEEEVKTFTVKNVGDEALEVSDVAVDVGLSFAIASSSPLSFLLEPGETQDIDVMFSPLGAENYGTVLVYSNDPDTPEAPVDLLGFGGVPELQITPTSYTFEDTFIPCGAEVDVEFKNIGNEPLEITDVAYTSGGLLSFDNRGVTLPFTLEPGEHVEVGVVFEATSAGADTGTIEVTSNDPRGVVTADQSGEGAYASEVTETFLEPGIPPVDVLWTIDQSGSMSADNRPDIRQGVPGFIAELDAVADYHLIQVTKDTGCANGGVIDNNTANAEDLLIDNAFNAGIFEQFTTEQLLKQVDVALQQTGVGGCNEGFLRPGALLHIIVASDEMDQSPHDHAYWITKYQAYVTDPNLVKVSAVVDVNYQCGDNTGPGEYLLAAQATGGVVLDICSPDWGAQMTDIASEVLAGIRSYNLSNATEQSTITVEVNGVETTDFSYSGAGNTVTINSPPVGEGDVVDITYFPAGDCQ
jgi:hypothetical protein